MGDDLRSISVGIEPRNSALRDVATPAIPADNMAALILKNLNAIGATETIAGNDARARMRRQSEQQNRNDDDDRTDGDENLI